MRFQGIIFDLDGTLVDTEPIHCRAWLKVLADNGLNFDEEWFEKWIGYSDRVLAEAVERNYRISVTADTLQEQKRLNYHRMATEHAEVFPMVENHLSNFKNDFRLAIATNSSDEDAASVFKKTKLDQYFSTVVTASQVDRMKPAPDMFYLASKRLGLFTDVCVVVEDSPAGIKGAKAAGMQVLAVANSHEEKSLQEADHIFPSTDAALQWINAL